MADQPLPPEPLRLEALAEEARRAAPEPSRG